MKTVQSFINLPLLIALIFFSGCKKDIINPKVQVEFSGEILDYGNNTVLNSEIKINEEVFKIDEEGRFEFVVDSAGQYLLNISARGYGPISKIFFTGVEDKVYRLRKATMVSANPANVIVVTDTQTECEARSKLSEDTLAFIKMAVPVMDQRGNIIGSGMPDELFDAFKAHELRNGCNSGATVRIPANALALPSGASGNVDVSISTIDIYSVDGMPGDWSVSGQRQSTYMVSMGAAAVDVFYKGEPVNLKKGEKAEIIIPVDPNIIEANGKVPDTIPFLIYNRQLGVWEQEGFGIFDVETQTYKAETSHFSEFNMDIYKTDPACIRFCIESNHEMMTLVSGSDKVEVLMKDADDFLLPIIPRSKTYFSGGASATGFAGCGNDLHLIYNLSPNSPMVLKITDSGGGTIKSLVVLVTGNPINAADLNPNNTVAAPYVACCTPGPGNCEDPCAGPLPILGEWTANQPVLFGVKDDALCKFTLHWYDNNVVGLPGDQSGLYTITATEGANSTILTGVTITEIDPNSGFFSADISICSAAPDLACDKNWTIKVKHQLFPESNNTCLSLLFTGCPTCTPCP